MFTKEGFTTANKRMMESIYGGLFSYCVKRVAEVRKKSEEEIKKLIDHGFYKGQEAF